FESRPARTGQWEYYFYVDVQGHRDDPQVARALADLQEQVAFIKVLRSYPAQQSSTRTRIFMTTAIKPSTAPAHVSAIAPYQAGKPIEELAREFGLDPAGIVKLASNETPLGMPESARHALTAAAGTLARYPDPNGFDLKAALAERYGVPMGWITLGNGSNDILEIA